VLLLKILNFLLAGQWLILNAADNRAEDYPLIRKKYALLLVIMPLLVAETVLLVLYIQGLNPDVITSCCGSLFSSSSRGVAADLASLPAKPLAAFFTAVLLLAAAGGVFFAVKGRGGLLVAAASLLAFLAGIASLISFIGPYAYELPTHHCPFCVLQRDYHYIGYLLYIGLLGVAVSGMGVGTLMPFRSVPSLCSVIPPFQRRLSVATVCFSVFLGAVVLLIVLSSNLRM